MASRTACCLLASWLLHLLAYREQEESLTNLSPAEQLKQLDVCAVGPLRVTAALLKHGLVKKATGKLVIISSQAGSVEWRRTQNKVQRARAPSLTLTLTLALAPALTLTLTLTLAPALTLTLITNQDKGHDYGHHMSRAACNIAAVRSPPLSAPLRPSRPLSASLRPSLPLSALSAPSRVSHRGGAPL